MDVLNDMSNVRPLTGRSAPPSQVQQTQYALRPVPALQLRFVPELPGETSPESRKIGLLLDRR